MDRDAYKRGYDAIAWRPLPEPERRAAIRPARADLPMPMVISDTMDATEHVDGRFYTSKSAFRRVTKERGYIEVGTESTVRMRQKMELKKSDIDRAVKKAAEKVLGV